MKPDRRSSGEGRDLLGIAPRPLTREPDPSTGFLDLEPVGGERAQPDSRDPPGFFPFPPADRAAAPPAVPWTSPGDAGKARVAVHEFGHAIIARLFAMPIGLVTIQPTPHFAGRCIGPAAKLDESVAEVIADALEICRRIREARRTPAKTASRSSHGCGMSRKKSLNWSPVSRLKSSRASRFRRMKVRATCCKP